MQNNLLLYFNAFANIVATLKYIYLVFHCSYDMGQFCIWNMTVTKYRIIIDSFHSNTDSDCDYMHGDRKWDYPHFVSFNLA